MSYSDFREMHFTVYWNISWCLRTSTKILNDQNYTAWDGHFERSLSNQNVDGPMRRELGQVGLH